MPSTTPQPATTTPLTPPVPPIPPRTLQSRQQLHQAPLLPHQLLHYRAAAAAAAAAAMGVQKMIYMAPWYHPQSQWDLFRDRPS